MSCTGEHNYCLTKGIKTDDIVYTIYTDETRTTLFDLTGYTALMRVKSKPTGGTTLFSLATGGDGITLGGAAGTITVQILGNETSALTGDKGYYDIKLIPAASTGYDHRVYIRGQITFNELISTVS